MKVLFCGLGSIGQRHLRNLRALMGDSVEVLAYRSKGRSPMLNPDMTVREGADVESTYGVLSFDDLNEALEQRPDAVFVTGPNSTHVPVALAAARVGCHLFIEKPLSCSAEGVDDLINVVDKNGLVAMVAYQFRFHPGLILLKSLIDTGKLGRLVAANIVNGEYLPDWHPYEDYRGTHAARKDLGGGCLNVQTHELDYALWLFGLPERLYAVGGHLSSLDVDVEDSVSILLRCEFGGKPFPVHIHLDYLQRPPQRSCEIIGDLGRVRYDYYQGQVELNLAESRRPEVTKFPYFDRNQMFLDELNHFLACLRGEERPRVDLREATRSLKVALAAQNAVATNECQPVV